MLVKRRYIEARYQKLGLSAEDIIEYGGGDLKTEILKVIDPQLYYHCVTSKNNSFMRAFFRADDEEYGEIPVYVMLNYGRPKVRKLEVADTFDLIKKHVIEKVP